MWDPTFSLSRLKRRTVVTSARGVRPETDRWNVSSLHRPPGSWNHAESAKEKYLNFDTFISKIIRIYLDELLLQVGPWTDPRCDCVAEEDEVVHDATRIDGYHVAHSTKCGILLFVVSNVSKRHAPAQSICLFCLFFFERVKRSFDDSKRKEMNRKLVAETVKADELVIRYLNENEKRMRIKKKRNWKNYSSV